MADRKKPFDVLIIEGVEDYPTKLGEDPQFWQGREHQALVELARCCMGHSIPVYAPGGGSRDNSFLYGDRNDVLIWPLFSGCRYSTDENLEGVLGLTDRPVVLVTGGMLYHAQLGKGFDGGFTYDSVVRRAEGDDSLFGRLDGESGLIVPDQSSERAVVMGCVPNRALALMGTCDVYIDPLSAVKGHQGSPTYFDGGSLYVPLDEVADSPVAVFDREFSLVVVKKVPRATLFSDGLYGLRNTGSP